MVTAPVPCKGQVKLSMWCCWCLCGARSLQDSAAAGVEADLGWSVAGSAGVSDGFVVLNRVKAAPGDALGAAKASGDGWGL